MNLIPHRNVTFRFSSRRNMNLIPRRNTIWSHRNENSPHRNIVHVLGVFPSDRYHRMSSPKVFKESISAGSDPTAYFCGTHFCGIKSRSYFCGIKSRGHISAGCFAQIVDEFRRSISAGSLWAAAKQLAMVLHRRVWVALRHERLPRRRPRTYKLVFDELRAFWYIADHAFPS